MGVGGWGWWWPLAICGSSITNTITYAALLQDTFCKIMPSPPNTHMSQQAAWIFMQMFSPYYLYVLHPKSPLVFQHALQCWSSQWRPPLQANTQQSQPASQHETGPYTYQDYSGFSFLCGPRDCIDNLLLPVTIARAQRTAAHMGLDTQTLF